MSDESEYETVSRITGGVYQSGFVSRFPDHIDAVLCLCTPPEMAWAARQAYPGPFAAAIKEYAWKPIPDDPRAVPSLDWLDAAAGLVAAWRGLGYTVLTHCAAGISRSTLVTAAYLMRRYGWAATDAVAFVKLGRPVVDPNSGFLKLLEDYGRQVLPVAADAARPAA